MTTIKHALNLGYNKTKSTLDAEVLLSFVLEKPKVYLYSNPEKKLSRKILNTYLALIKQRTKGVPVAYLTGGKEFFGLKFKINKNVLIPRPETETLVDLVLKGVKVKGKGLRILDLGTGSGAIIISLAKAMATLSPRPYTLFYASDISQKALVVARKNARLHQVRITFKQGSLLSPWKNQKFDIIVANLPYGWKAWKNNTSAATVGLKFEPQEALFTGKKGLALIEKLLRQISTLHPEPCTLFLEFDPRQTSQIKNLALKHLPGFEIKIYKDLAGRNRFIRLSSRP